jgi:[ribosomal protein S18]-alanine N-acetyltransferase
MTPAPACLEPVRWWDLPDLVALERLLFGDDAWSEATWWGELAQSGTRRYLLERDPASGAVRGYAGVAVNGADADIMTVAVAPDAQGQGLGGRLVQALVDAAADAGATQLLLEVRADNVPAQRLYTRRGFERIAVRRGYYSGGVDAWILRLRPLRAGADSPSVRTP